MEGQNNMEEPLNSSHSIKILRNESTNLLSAMLNPIKVIPTSKGLSRNWKGLAELCLIDSNLIRNLEYKTDPTRELLHIWQSKGEHATIQQLIVNLEKLDRFDVIEDISKSIADDVQYHNQHPNGLKRQIPPLFFDNDKCVLTVDDVENSQLIKYDAFVLFAYDDIDFATEVVETMEKQYNLKFCVKDRDLFGGTFEYEAIIKLISDRCEKLIVILSPSFFNSPMNKFFLNYTQAISLEQRKIIPCLYKQCPNMPPEIRCYFMLDYTKSTALWNFWDKLYESIKTKKAPANASNRVVRRDQPPRQLNFRTNSQRDTETKLRLPNQTVKYNSVGDLSKADVNQILPETNLMPSTSSNTLGIVNYSEPEKKIKSKKNWLQKLLAKNGKNYENCSQHIKTNGDVASGRGKKGLRSWNMMKRKVEVAT